MAIIKITNNVDTLRVPAGSFESMYKPLGFEIVGGKTNKKAVKKEDVAEILDDEENAIFLDAIMQIPVDDWKKEDVKKFIQIKGIDASSAKKPHEYKALIKEYLESEK